MSFNKTLDTATSHLRLEPDWPSIIHLCDLIRQNEISPKNAINSIKKKMNSPNPHSAKFALLVLESIVKNCGAPVHDEICTAENCQAFTTFIEKCPHDNVKTKMLELIQAWASVFGGNDKYLPIKDTLTILKSKGYIFPDLLESGAMFKAETAPEWSDSKVCDHCRVAFTMLNRKHHCRNCGQVFCQLCSSKKCTLPKYGMETEVRVCDVCYSLIIGGGKSGSGGAVSQKIGDNDLPEEYLTSSLAQQSQTPPRKTEQELKEEEELELALALSESEAAQKNQLASSTYQTTNRKSPSITVSSQNNTPFYTQPITVNAAPIPADEPPSDPELAKYLNRDYWEQRKTIDSPASPSAPSPMSQTSSIIPLKVGPEDVEIDEFSNNMRTQVEIFVNRMKSNSSRGRNIVTDSSVQSLFITLTSMHSRLLGYIKEMDDKRMWYEQLQDKLAQVKDSRAALDVLRQEHQDKLRLIAEEQERQRQMLLAHKLDIMRKKKQEYLQYQRQLALQRLHEQEREMQMRQEQQKALYQMGGGVGVNFGYLPANMMPQQLGGSPIHQMLPPTSISGSNNGGSIGGLPPGAPGSAFAQYGYNPQMNVVGGGLRYGNAVGNIPPNPHDIYGTIQRPSTHMQSQMGGMIQQQQQQQQPQQHQLPPQGMSIGQQYMGGQPPPQQQQQQKQQTFHGENSQTGHGVMNQIPGSGMIGSLNQQQIIPQQLNSNQQMINQQLQLSQQQQHHQPNPQQQPPQHQLSNSNMPPLGGISSPQHQQIQQQQQPQQQQPNDISVSVQQQPPTVIPAVVEPPKPTGPAEAELISFD